MKKIFKIFGIVSLFVAVLVSAFGLPEAVETWLDISSVGGSVMALVPWMVTKGTEQEFKELSPEELKELSDEEYGQYMSAKFEGLEDNMEKLIAEKAKASEERLKEIQEEINNVNSASVGTMKEAMKNMAATIARLEENGVDKDSNSFKSAMRKSWDEKADELKDLGSGQSLSITLKAEQTYGDIADGIDFAQMKPGITDAPVRKPVFKSLFPVIPIQTEFLEYTEQNTVVRDAQNVAKCSEVISTTKETLVVNSISTKVIQDTIDFCRMFVSDYAFMASRIRKLLEQSIALRSDQQVLLGTGAGEETFSINSVSSDFSAANPVCVLTAKIQAPNLVDLISGMATQIFELGEQNAYIPDTAIVNNCDWFTDVASLKDQNNNYLDTRVIVQGGKTFIVTLMGLIEVVTSPLVPQNDCYVFDRTKGDIVDRMETQIDVSFENKDNFVKHIGTLLGWERFNFLVENNNANAFMRCLDIAAALIAITKP